MKKAIVIGASGFLGKHLLKALNDEAIQVYAVHHKSPVVVEREYQINGGINVLDHNLIDKIAPDYIFHCARPVLPRFKRAGRFIAAWIAWRKNDRLIKQLNKSITKPLLVFASGSLMYGNAEEAHAEESPLKPISYAKQYFHGEKPMLRAIRNGEYPVCMLRLPWLLGSGSWFKWFFLNIMRNKQFVPLYSSENNSMEILDVKDAARLIIQYANSGKKGIYNLPGKEAYSSSDFYSAVSKIFEMPLQEYNEIFPDGIEKEALEAFTSNIALATNFPDLINVFSYRTLDESLKEIKSEYEEIGK